LPSYDGTVKQVLSVIFSNFWAMNVQLRNLQVNQSNVCNAIASTLWSYD